MASADGPQLSAAAQELLDPAWQMRWRVPELALPLSDRAIAYARSTGERALRLRAEAIALFALKRLGHGVTSVHRAVAAVRDAEAANDEEVTAELRVELACIARQAGSHEVAARVLAPVLCREKLDPIVRAHALTERAAWPPDGSDAFGPERVRALDEAEQLYNAAEPHRDTNRVLRAHVNTIRASVHRRHGRFTAAADTAQAGLGLLSELDDQTADSGELYSSLVVERVHALLELGRRSDALATANPVLHQPVRAASAGPSGWLRFALATRVFLADGERAAGLSLLNEAVATAERHAVDTLLAEALSTLSHVYEQGEEFTEALRCLRGAYAADRRWRSSLHTARIRLLREFPAFPAQTRNSEPARGGAHGAAGAPNAHGTRATVGSSGKPATHAPASSGPEPVTREQPAIRESGSPATFPVPPATAAEATFAAPPATAEHTASDVRRDTPADTPAVSDSYSEAVERSFRQLGEGNVRDAARRLMETLTGRSSNVEEQASSDASRSSGAAPTKRSSSAPSAQPDPADNVASPSGSQDGAVPRPHASDQGHPRARVSEGSPPGAPTFPVAHDASETAARGFSETASPMSGASAGWKGSRQDTTSAESTAGTTLGDTAGLGASSVPEPELTTVMPAIDEHSGPSGPSFETSADEEHPAHSPAGGGNEWSFESLGVSPEPTTAPAPEKTTAPADMPASEPAQAANPRRGKSLAEIRASLRLVQERSGVPWNPSDEFLSRESSWDHEQDDEQPELLDVPDSERPSADRNASTRGSWRAGESWGTAASWGASEQDPLAQGGKRRARHAEPDEPARSNESTNGGASGPSGGLGGEPASEFLARYRRGAREDPPPPRDTAVSGREELPADHALTASALSETPALARNGVSVEGASPSSSSGPATTSESPNSSGFLSNAGLPDSAISASSGTSSSSGMSAPNGVSTSDESWDSGVGPDSAASGEHSGLADLLAEALVAYETGRRDEAEASSDPWEYASRYGSVRSGGRARPATAYLNESTSDVSASIPSARHRDDEIDTSASRFPSWTPGR